MALREQPESMNPSSGLGHLSVLERGVSEKQADSPSLSA